MPGTKQEVVLQVSRRYDAPRERVFDAWTSPEVLKKWWAVHPEWHGEIAEVDLRPGGRYRLGMRDPESGTAHIVKGEYTEVRRPEKLAFTGAWEGHPLEPDGSSETLVEIDFVEDGDATEATLTHSGFANEEIRGPIIARQLSIGNSSQNHYVPFGTLLPGMPASYQQVTTLEKVDGSFTG